MFYILLHNSEHVHQVLWFCPYHYTMCKPDGFSSKENWSCSGSAGKNAEAMTGKSAALLLVGQTYHLQFPITQPIAQLGQGEWGSQLKATAGTKMLPPHPHSCAGSLAIDKSDPCPHASQLPRHPGCLVMPLHPPLPKDTRTSPYFPSASYLIMLWYLFSDSLLAMLESQSTHLFQNVNQF